MLRSMVILAIVVIGATGIASGARAQSVAQCAGESQLEMNLCAANDFRAADAALNRVYRAALAPLVPAERAALRKAQRAWLRYRDAECDFVAALYEGGSMQPMQKYACLASVRNARVAELRVDGRHEIPAPTPPPRHH